MQQVTDKDPELDRNGLIQAVAIAEFGTDLLGRPLAESHLAGVSGEQPRNREDHEDDADQNRDGQQQSASDELDHWLGV